MRRLDHLTRQCDEVLMLIFYYLDGKTVSSLSRTCRKLHNICTYDQQLWSHMCLMDFAIGLVVPHPFSCFRHLYKCLYQSREVLRFYLSDEYQDCSNTRYGVFPGWLWTWIVFNTNPPLLPEWIRNYHEPFLRYKLSEISLGKTLRVWSLKSSDLPAHIVTRVEYGTSYYRWRDIQVAAMRVHGGPKGFERFMLRRCWRARGYVERAFERIQNGTFMLPTRSKRGESSTTQSDARASRISQISSQSTRQMIFGSRQVEHAPRQAENALRHVGHASGRVGHAFGQIAHASGQAGHGSSQIGHAYGGNVHESSQLGHGSGQSVHAFRPVSTHGREDRGENSRNPTIYVHSSSSSSSMESD